MAAEVLLAQSLRENVVCISKIQLSFSVDKHAHLLKYSCCDEASGFLLLILIVSPLLWHLQKSPVSETFCD